MCNGKSLCPGDAWQGCPLCSAQSACAELVSPAVKAGRSLPPFTDPTPLLQPPSLQKYAESHKLPVEVVCFFSFPVQNFSLSLCPVPNGFYYTRHLFFKLFPVSVMKQREETNLFIGDGKKQRIAIAIRLTLA